MHSRIDYARSYRNCEEEDLRRTGRVQAGFHVLVLSGGEVIGQSDGFPYDARAVAEALADGSPGQRVSAHHTLVSLGPYGTWLKHSAGDATVFEQPDVSPPLDRAPPLDREELRDAARGNLWKLCFAVCRSVQEALQADRVMVYRFLEDWSGEVIAEAVQPHLDPFLGLRYPPTDIPSDARSLYAEMTTRHIFSSRRADRRLQGPGIDAGSIDLSLAVSRSVSPYHIEYLRSMGSESTASCAMMVDGRLWGLVSLHFQRHRSPSLDEFVYLQQARHVVEDLINEVLAVEGKAQAERLQRLQDQFREDLDQHSDPFRTMALSRTAIHRLLGAQGLSLLIDNDLCNIGKTPTVSAIRRLCRGVGASLEPLESRFIDELPAEIAPADRRGLAGCSITRISDVPDAFALTYRIEVNQTVNWGGDPRRQSPLDEQSRVSPRRSFEKWVESVEGRCAPWTPLNVESLDLAFKALQRLFDMSPRALSLLILNGYRQTLRRSGTVRSAALDLIDGVQSAIAVCVERRGQGEGQIIAMNSSALDAFAIAPAEVTGLPLKELERITSVDLSHAADTSFMATLTTANNGIRECEVSIGLLFEATTLDGTTDPFRIQLLEFRDVTETKRIEAALTAARDRLMRDAQLRSEYFAKLGHELRTPLNALVGFSDLLLTEDSPNLSDGARKALSLIHQSSTYMSEIVTSTLENAAAVQTVDENCFEEITLVDLANEVIGFIQRSIDARGLIVEVAVPEHLTVFADPRGLRQVLLNLLSNAIKYNVPEGSITIGAKKQPAGLVEISVRDTGLGMSEQQVEACMIPFRRFSDQEGAGLGLSISHHLVSLMGGVINVQSTMGEGTTVELVLPSSRRGTGAEIQVS